MSRLALTRKPLQSICIGDEIVVTVIHIRDGKVRLAVDAPESVSVDREEVRLEKIRNAAKSD